MRCVTRSRQKHAIFKGPRTSSPSWSQFSSVTQSCPTLQPHGLQHARPPCSIPAPRVYPNSCSLSRGCHPTISSSVVPFSSGPQSFPAPGPFPMSQLFASGGQSIFDYNVVLVSAVHKSDSVIDIQTCVCIYIFFFRFFPIVVDYRILNIVPCTIQ